MRILLVNKFLARRGGVETYLIDLARLLEKAGHDVQCYGMEDPDAEVGNRYGIYAPAMELGGSQGISKALEVPRTIRSRENASRMGDLMRAFKPDVVHFNNIHYHLTPAVIEAAAAFQSEASRPVGLVMTMHDYHSVVPCDGCMNNSTYEICEECLDGSYARCARRCCTRGGRAKSVVASAEAAYWHCRHVYRRLGRVVCPSNYMKVRFDQVMDFRGRTVHLPNFTNVERRVYQKADYVLYFGAYNRDKGVGTLLDVAERHPEIPFKFAGRGPLAGRIKDVANAEDLGFNTGERLREIVGRATLTAVPSEWLENSPFAVLEALCSGTPVLGANIGGIPELIEPGVTGELFEFRNPADLEAKLVSLWGDKPRLARYAANCAGFAPMTGEGYVERLLAVYEEARSCGRGEGA